MNCNIGKSDKIMRIVVGSILIGAGFFLSGTMSIVLWVIGAVALITGIIGSCPMYSLIKINTCNR